VLSYTIWAMKISFVRENNNLIGKVGYGKWFLLESR